jgi:hypothetical protein
VTPSRPKDTVSAPGEPSISSVITIAGHDTDHAKAAEAGTTRHTQISPGSDCSRETDPASRRTNPDQGCFCRLCNNWHVELPAQRLYLASFAGEVATLAREDADVDDPDVDASPPALGEAPPAGCPARPRAGPGGLAGWPPPGPARAARRRRETPRPGTGLGRRAAATPAALGGRHGVEQDHQPVRVGVVPLAAVPAVGRQHDAAGDPRERGKQVSQDQPVPRRGQVGAQTAAVEQADPPPGHGALRRAAQHDL